MTLSELKNNLLEEVTSEKLILFVCPENFYLAEQYTNRICELRGLARVDAESIYERQNALSLVLSAEGTLNVIKTDVFTERAEDYSGFTDTIIICTKVDKQIQPLVSEYIIEVPKLEEWQVLAFMQNYCPALTTDDLSWLYAAAKGNIYRIINELDKLKLFNNDEQAGILASLRFDKYSDLYSITPFALVDAIITKDMATLADFMAHQEACNFELLSITALTLLKIKQIILITQNSGCSATDIGVSTSQFKYISYNYRGYSLDYLRTMLRKLSNIDTQLKAGKLDLKKEKQLEYLILKLLG